MFNIEFSHERRTRATTPSNEQSIYDGKVVDVVDGVDAACVVDRQIEDQSKVTRFL